MLKRIISTFLVLLMLVSSMTLLISAENAENSQEEQTEETTGPVYEFNTNKNKQTMNYWEGEYIPDPDKPSDIVPVDTKEKKLEVMDLRLEQNGFRMYVDEFSGEVAVENIETGDIMFTNPYNVSYASKNAKTEYLSQIIIDYKDLIKNEEKTYYSYSHCVRASVPNGVDPSTIVDDPSQLTVKYIKNGIRVEYAIGRIDTRYMVPEIISEDMFKELILDVAIEAGCTEFEANQLKYFFLRRYVPDNKKLQYLKGEEYETELKKFLESYPGSDEQPMMAFTGVTPGEFKSIESIIKRYCPDVTYELIDSIYLDLDYKPKDQKEALFNISLEYTIDEKGLSVRIPANGIRFDESSYLLKDIQILPFMGAGENPNAGYTLFPDGSGALFDFQELAGEGANFYGTCYGEDFAYYNLASGAPHNEVVRYPVYGLKEDIVDENGNEHSRGFLAIVEEGESLMTLESSHTFEYNSVRMRINPRPYDSYKMSDAISVGGNATWTVVSPRKYTGNFKIRYIMLTDSDVATGDGYYDTSYVGMAIAYREYLEEKGILTKLTSDDIKEDIPLYIETFGAIETTEKFLSIPYNAMKPLASFGDISKMYDALAAKKIENVNFILTGYNKGGLSVDQMPYKLNWENAVEKDMKFDELLDYAKQKDFGLYPDFDFVFATDNKLFDGMSFHSHAIKAIDGRYTSKREYSATRQSYVSYFELAMSPAYFSRFYERISKDYLKYDPIGISVSTLGSYLNSDFDEDEPYNREDSKEFTIKAFQHFNTNYNKVLTSGGNAYTWKYVDYITDIATDSSRHAKASATVPFLGMVLHGYVQFAGEAINMEGNIDYALLRALENGASLKFILSYRNTEKLKENPNTSKYYSVRYDIWLDELVDRYNDINGALSDVQLNTIVHHQFIEGVRIPNTDEITSDSANALLNAIDKEIFDAAQEKALLRATVQAIKTNLYDCRDNMAAIVDPNSDKYIKTIFKASEENLTELQEQIVTVKEAKDALDALIANPEEGDKYAVKLENYQANYDMAVETLADLYNKYIKAANIALDLGQNYIDKYEMARDNFDLIDPNNIYFKDEYEVLKNILSDYESTYYSLKSVVRILRAQVAANVGDIEKDYADVLGLVEQEEEQVAGYSKYAAAKNSIAYEIYDSGKAFVLNFNNYAVKIKLGNAYYTIDAYSYITFD